MKNIVLAAVLALIAVPALAVGPESFSVDVSRGYAVTAPCNGPSCSQAQEQRSNWAPRGQQAQDSSSEEGSEATTSRQPRAMKASGKPRQQRSNASQAPQSGNQAGRAPASGSGAAPASEGHR